MQFGVFDAHLKTGATSDQGSKNMARGIDAAMLNESVLCPARQLGEVGLDKPVFAQRRVGFSESDDFVRRPYGGVLFELDSFQRCDLTRLKENYFHSANTAEQIRDASTSASPVRQTGEYF